MRSTRTVWILGCSLFVTSLGEAHLQAQPVNNHAVADQAGVRERDATPVFGPPLMARPATTVPAPEPAPAAERKPPAPVTPPAPPAFQKVPPPPPAAAIAPKPLSPTPAASAPKPVDPVATTPPAPSADKLPPALLRQGPSMYETGRVGKMGVSEAGTQIGQTRNRAMPNEQRIDAKTDDGRAVAANGPVGVVNATVLKREIRSRFALLKNCPTEIARGRRIATASVTASHLTLRWTILPGGQVAETQVVATSPTDGQVMDCVKREMSQWSFTPPRGGPVRLERPFRFRAPTTANTAGKSGGAQDSAQNIAKDGD